MDKYVIKLPEGYTVASPYKMTGAATSQHHEPFEWDIDFQLEKAQLGEAFSGWDGWGDEPIVCEHEWVDTGVPGGMLFCKHCDEDAPDGVRWEK
jgi:hypothetical protein